MASTTSNIGLTKPAGTEKALVSVINSNSDIIDSAAGGLMDAIAIVANGNTHAAISAGQYVYVHNHGTLAEGLYTASSAIAANATLSTSNLTADASGGLNALNSNTTTNANALTLEAKSLYPVIDGNKCNKNVAYGEYVYVRNSTIANISEGLHWAYKAITANTVIDSSYLVVAREAATINSLSSSIPKYYYGSENTSSISPSSNSTVTVPVPTGATSVLAVIPFGFVPATHWNSTIVFTNVSGRVISIRCVGSGNAQVFAVKYCAIYI